jgi:hypothetical protein
MVETAVLDDEIQDDVFVLKLDVQGHEQHVILGAQELLKTVPFVLTEFWPVGLKRYDCRVCFRGRDGQATHAMPHLRSTVASIPKRCN